MQNFIQSKKGFTLIEGILATAILSSSLIVGLSLAISNLNAARTNNDRIIADNLAREGLEVVRNIRDSNWLKRDNNIDKDPVLASGIQFYNWNDYFDGWPTFPEDCSAGECYGTYFDVILSNPPSNGSYMYSLKKVQSTIPDVIYCIDDNTPDQIPCHVQQENGVYFQSTVAPSGGAVYSPYYRRITLKPLCRNVLFDDPYIDANISTVNFPRIECSTGDTMVGVLATSHVIWKKGNKILEVKAKERLYNWRDL